MASIGHIAWALKVSTSSLKRWEYEGLIPKPSRRPTGMRDYGTEEIETIRRFIAERQNERKN